MNESMEQWWNDTEFAGFFFRCKHPFYVGIDRENISF
jgi:hypothetical protein